MLRKFIYLGFIATIGCSSDATELKTQDEKLSYIFGQQLANDFKNIPIKISDEAFMAGLKDAQAGKSLLTDEQKQAIMQQFQMVAQAEAQAKMKKDGDDNMDKGEAFLAQNKTKEGVVTTATGLQYKVIKSGKGKTPKPSDIVETHYRGTLITGEEFDSSYKRGETISFPVNKVIPGWTEALQLMKEGDKWELYIPSDLAYGPRGAGGVIGPNETLIFEIELVAVK